jgi:uncharacterized protein (TIGR00730 family)
MSKKYQRPDVPKPPSAVKRNVPLPWESPKPKGEDAESPSRLQAILNSPSYKPAVEDVDFLDSDYARSVRLQLDYMKTYQGFKKEGIDRTLVVFGSTRIVEPAAARLRVEQRRDALAGDPDNSRLQHQLFVAEKILAKSHYYETAREFTRLVATESTKPDKQCLTIVTGGGPGMMEAANRGADDVSAKTVGLNITLPHEQYPNPYVTPELCFQFHYFALRKMHFIMRAKALVVFPGGFGTFDELFETLTLIQTRKIKPLPVVLVGREYWRRAFDVNFLVEEGVIDEEDRDLFWYAETAQEIWDGLLCWYENGGEKLI